MNRVMNNFRTALLTVCAIVSVVPQTVLASGMGSFGRGKGGSDHPIAHTASSISSSKPTISSSSGSPMAHTAIGSMNQSVTNVDNSSHYGQNENHTGTSTGIAAVGNLSGTPSKVQQNSTAPSKQVMDFDPVGALGSLLDDATGSSTDYAGYGGPNNPKGPSGLTNGSQGQYGDGAPMNYPAGTPGNPYPKGAKDSGKISDSSTRTGLVHEKAPRAQTLNSVSGSDIGKNALRQNNFATAKNAGGSDIGKYVTGGSTSSQPSPPNPPAPPKPTPTPKPSSSGPIFVGGSTSDASTVSTTDNTATPDTTATPAAATGIDLVLEDVQLASSATLVAGPAYTVKFRNQGRQAAGKFQVGILAGLDGKLVSDAPRALVEVESLAAGQVKEVTLRLPLKSMQLHRPGQGLPTAFTHLFVAVDLNNTVAETDETNNTAIVERAALESSAQ